MIKAVVVEVCVVRAPAGAEGVNFEHSTVISALSAALLLVLYWLLELMGINSGRPRVIIYGAGLSLWLKRTAGV